MKVGGVRVAQKGACKVEGGLAIDRGVDGCHVISYMMLYDSYTVATFHIGE